MAGNWWYRTFGQEFGPITLDTIQSLYADGVLDADDLVRSEDESQWRPIRAVKEISRTTPMPSVPPSRENTHFHSAVDDILDMAPSASEPAIPPKTTDETLDNTNEKKSTTSPDHPPVVHSVSIKRATQDCLKRLNAKQKKQAKRMPRIRASGGDFLAAVSRFLSGAIRRCRGPFETLYEILPKRVLMIGIIAVSVLVLGIRFLPSIQSEHISEETAYQELNRIVGELRELRTSKADDSQWESYITRSKETGGELVADLQARAAVDRPVSMDLLRAARDYLPKMLHDARRSESSSERQFVLHVQRAGKSLAQKEDRREVYGILAWCFTGLNVVVCLSLLIHSRRAGRNK